MSEEQQIEETIRAVADSFLESQLAEKIAFGADDRITKARDQLHDLLGASCEVPLARVAELATDLGLATHQLLGEAERSESCWVDYKTGYIRCNQEEGS